MLAATGSGLFYLASVLKEIPMAEYELVAEPRTLTGKKVKRLRAKGYVPVVVYGGGGEPENLQIPARVLEPVIERAGITNLLSLRVGESQDRQVVLVREVERDAIRGTINHLDLMRVVMGEEITTEVTIVLMGEAPVGGMVVQDMTSVQVSCLPKDLISTIEVDLATLSMVGSMVSVKDLDVPDSITILAEGDDLVAHIEVLAMDEEEEEPKPAPVVPTVSVFGEVAEESTTNE
jgi:large subunit ribosomal protein L25